MLLDLLLLQSRSSDSVENRIKKFNVWGHKLGLFKEKHIQQKMLTLASGENLKYHLIVFLLLKSHHIGENLIPTQSYKLYVHFEKEYD